MKKSTLLIIGFLVAGVASTTAQNVGDILAAADEAFELSDVYSRSTLTITRNGREQATQVMESFQSDAADGTVRSLSVFSAPPRVAGTAYLMIGNDLWIRFASTGRVRKMSSSARTNAAAGSDFSYADMGDGSRSFTAGYSARLDGMESIRGVDAHRIVLTPTQGDAAYERLVAWVSAEELIYLRVQYWTDGAPIKVMDLEDYRRVGNVHYPFVVRMRSLTNDSVSEIVTQEIVPASPRVEDRLFSSTYLRSLR